MSKLITHSIFMVVIAFVLTSGAANAQGYGGGNRCYADGSIQVCVLSAALSTGFGFEFRAPTKNVAVSLTLQIQNMTDYPIGMAMLQEQFAFTPQNAETIMSGNTIPNVSGLPICYSRQNCQFVTVAPKRAALTQIRYEGSVTNEGLQLVHIASFASFSASLFIDERGQIRVVPISLNGFAFGNTLPRVRN